MKTMMVKLLGIALITGVSANLSLGGPPSPAVNHGLQVLDEKQAELLATTNAPTATGHVKTLFHQAPKVTQQFLQIQVDDLETNSTYQIRATMTNGVSYAAGALLTDKYGWGELHLRARVGPGKNLPKSWPLAPELQPASQIVHVEVLDTNSVVVLDANLNATNPGFRMHAVADLRVPGASRSSGQAQLWADSTSAKFAVHGSKSPRAVDVQVRVDGIVVGSGKTNKSGTLQLKGTLPGDMDAARVRLIEVINGGGTVLLTGSLPN